MLKFLVITTFILSNTQPDHKHATSTATRHPYRPASNKSLTFAPKRARPSIIRISSGREFQRRHA
ncbi:hypothetical protein J6590_023960 [Homalodisca vitripennis]|nr:hypothetical protein J6590_023960 [Homalodisca vitripennis]